MKNWQAKHRFQRIISSRVVQGGLLLILILIGKNLFTLYKNERSGALEEKALERDVSALKNRQAELEAEIAALGTDRGVEEKIRERFGVVKEGEKVINLVGGVATTDGPVEPDPWWQKVIDWLK